MIAIILFFREGPYQNAAFCIEHRLTYLPTTVNILLQQFPRLAALTGY